MTRYNQAYEAARFLEDKAEEIQILMENVLESRELMMSGEVQ